MVLSFLLVIAVLGVISALFGFTFIKRNVVKRAQTQVQNDLKAARAVYNGELEKLGASFNLISSISNPARLKAQLGLDYFFVIDLPCKDSIRDPLVRSACRGVGGGGARLIDSEELYGMGGGLAQRSRIAIKKTPYARPLGLSRLSGAMAMEYAMPYRSAEGLVVKVLYGGKIVNCSDILVDKIHDIVFESKLYRNKPMGTVTIFQDDVRIATNVLTDDGRRAIGTRVSAQVYENVVQRGTPWIDRAFVVTDWYLSAYEPIRDIGGAIIGIFYVGILEQPFNDLIRSTLIGYLCILGIAAVFAGGIAFFLASGISKPLTRFADATDTVAAGDLTHRVRIGPSIDELSRLASSFNDMAAKLHERESSLTRTNEQLSVLNSRYLDLIGMVTHELNGILASVMLNACSVRDGYLGDINDRQKNAMASAVRNLEYFDLTVKNFLNLSHIEKNEFTLVRRAVSLKEDIVDPSVEALAPQAAQRGMTIENLLPAAYTLRVDSTLMIMVMNNLIGNAVKYGDAGGRISIRMRGDCALPAVEVFNTGCQLSEAETGKLFKRFSRLDRPEVWKVRGVGLGLFLSKKTVEQHGGTLWCEPRDTGNAFIFTLPLTAST